LYNKEVQLKTICKCRQSISKTLISCSKVGYEAELREDSNPVHSAVLRKHRGWKPNHQIHTSTIESPTNQHNLTRHTLTSLEYIYLQRVKGKPIMEGHPNCSQ